MEGRMTLNFIGDFKKILFSVFTKVFVLDLEIY